MKQESEYHEREAMFCGSVPYIMGTRFGILMLGLSSAKAANIWNDICRSLDSLDGMLNRFDQDSSVSKINSLLSVKRSADISEEMERLLSLCSEYYIKTKGLFDITLKKFSELNVSCRKLFAGLEGMALDFGGFAKGYALDKIRLRLLEEGIENAFVDFGGSSILALGHHPYGDCWKVELKDPFNGKPLKDFSLRNRALSISGNTPHYSGHIVEPRSGAANYKRMLCSVEGGSPLDAEVLSTVVMALGEKPDEEILRAFEGMEINIFKTNDEERIRS